MRVLSMLQLKVLKFESELASKFDLAFFSQNYLKYLIWRMWPGLVTMLLGFLVAILRLTLFSRVFEVGVLFNIAGFFLIAGLAKSFVFGQLDLFRTRLRKESVLEARRGLIWAEWKRHLKRISLLVTCVVLVWVWYGQLEVPRKNIVVMTYWVLILKLALDLCLSFVHSIAFAHSRVFMPVKNLIVLEIFLSGLLYLSFDSIGPWALFWYWAALSTGQLVFEALYYGRAANRHHFQWWHLWRRPKVIDPRISGALGDRYAHFKSAMVMSLARLPGVILFFVLMRVATKDWYILFFLAAPGLRLAEMPGRSLYFDLRRSSGWPLTHYFRSQLGKILKGALWLFLIFMVIGIFNLTWVGGYFILGELVWDSHIALQAMLVFLVVPIKAALSIAGNFWASVQLANAAERDRSTAHRISGWVQFFSLESLAVEQGLTGPHLLQFEKGPHGLSLLKRLNEALGPSAYIFAPKVGQVYFLCPIDVEPEAFEIVRISSGFVKRFEKTDWSTLRGKWAGDSAKPTPKSRDVADSRLMTELLKKGSIVVQGQRLISEFQHGKLMKVK